MSSRRLSCDIGAIAVAATFVTMLAAGRAVAIQAPAPAPTPLAFADGRVTFTPPAGFTPLSSDEIAAKFPRGTAPRYVVGNVRRTTTVVYDLLEQRPPSSDLQDVRKAFTGIYEKALSGVKWIANDVRRLGRRDWAYLEFSAKAADQDIQNIVIISVYDGRLLMFNFNSTVAEFPKVERALRASIESITTKP